MRAHALTIASELRSATPPGTDPHQAREAEPLPRVARAQQLHLPRLPRVLPPPRGRPGRLATGPRHRARPAALRPALCRQGTRAHAGCEPGRSRLHHPHHHQGQLARDGPPRRLPRLHLDQAVRRPRRVRGRAALPRPLRLGGLQRHDPRHPAARRARPGGARACTGLSADSHSGKDILQILETYPRDELFQTSSAQLAEIATSVLHLQERRKTKLFLRRDEFGRFVSCLVYLPRDRYNTTVRLRIEAILLEAFGGENIDNTTRVSESTLARLHFVVRMPSGADIPDVDEAALEQRVIDATRTWDEDLSERARRGAGPRGSGADHGGLREGPARGVQGGLRRRDGGRRPRPHRRARRGRPHDRRCTSTTTPRPTTRASGASSSTAAPTCR